ncbi:MAG: hypothetical protein ACQESR_10635 [Planctomycetota bacterium]
MARCPAQAVLPLVGLAAEKVIRDRYIGFGFTSRLAIFDGFYGVVVGWPVAGFRRKGSRL